MNLLEKHDSLEEVLVCCDKEGQSFVLGTENKRV